MFIRNLPNRSFRFLKLFVVAFAAMQLTSSVSAGEKVDELAMEKALLAHVRPLLDSLRERKVKVVGVLKFVVKREGYDLSSSEGTLNMRLAEKTEQALVVATPPSADAIERQIGVVKNATATASKIPDATHLHKDDQAKREKLFDQTYKLAWSIDGKDEAVPDAFVYGVAFIHSDSIHIDIELVAFVKGQKELIEQASFRTVLGLEDQTSLGEGHLVGRSTTNRKTGEASDTYEESARESILSSKKTPGQHVLQREDAPVGVELEFAGVKQPLQFLPNAKTGEIECKVREPKAGQSFVVKLFRKKPADTARYGIVLKVNGENTLYRQRLPDGRCSFWVLEPNAQSLIVPGYQKTKGTDGVTEPFLVVEGAAALNAVEFYGQEAGLISLTVYGEKTRDQLAENLAREDEPYRLIQDTVLPEETAKNVSQLKGRLSNSILGEIQTRGMVVPSEKVQRNVTKEVDFKREDRPFFSASIRYYRP